MTYWTTYDGIKIRIRDLEFDHLKNIVRDGYRNRQIISEAKKRGIPVPEKVQVTLQDYLMYVEAVHSCAIEGISDPGLTQIAEEKNMQRAISMLSIYLNRKKFDEQTMKIVITRHALKRGKERFNLNRDALTRMAQKAWDGYTDHKWVKKHFGMLSDPNKIIKTHGNYVFIFYGTRLVTLYPVSEKEKSFGQ